MKEGILVIDKPQGITSFGVIARLRKFLGVKKIGHAGTLDPLATGVLIVGVGRSTKQLKNYVGLDKEYEAEMQFGLVSDTDDSTGKLEKRHCIPVSIDALREVLMLFLGDISQVPPQFSAVKISGQRAYKLARNGQKVVLQPRKIYIYSIDLLEFSWPIARIRVFCSTGTYIRALIRDIGEKLECGAVMISLRRTKVGEYGLHDSHSLESFSNKSS